MTKQAWPKVRTRNEEVKGRKYTYWIVDCGILNGSRKTHTYKTEKEAIKKAEAIRREQAKIGKVALRLSDAQKQEAARAYEILNGAGSLIDAVEFFVAHACPDGGHITVKQLLELFVEAKTQAGRREATLHNIRVRVGRFAHDFGDTPVHRITTHDLEKWMRKHRLSGTNQNNYRRVLVGFFDFARRRKYIRSNPAAELEKPTLDDKLPEIFTVEETERVLRAAEKHRPDMIPYFALCIFAGLRPAEAQEYDLADVDFESCLIPVRPTVAKKRRQRYIEMSNNLGHWLAPFGGGKAVYSRKGLELVRVKAKIPWAHDIMRHTFASYHLAMHEDVAKTALQMGHLRPDVLFNHYRNLVRRSDAERFWSLTPEAERYVE